MLPVIAKPYKHQSAGCKFALSTFKKHPCVALLADMGTGKTLMTIAIAGSLYLESKVNKLLIVCPKSIVGVWENEFGKFANYDYTLTVLSGVGDKKVQSIKNKTGKSLQIIVVNYESCWRLEKEITKWKPDMVVCDESSKIKNPQAKQSKSIHHIGKTAKYRMILTGTPITNSPLDFYSQYKFLNEKIFGTSFYSFRAKYAVMGGYGMHQIVAYKNMAELVEKAHSIAFRIKIQDAVDLPDYIDDIRAIELEPEAKDVYESIDKDSFVEFENGGEITVRNVLTRLLREGELLPTILNIPTGSLSDFNAYIQRLLKKGKKSANVVTKFSLKKVQNKSGISYSQVTCAVDRELTLEEIKAVNIMATEVKEFAGKVVENTVSD